MKELINLFDLSREVRSRERHFTVSNSILKASETVYRICTVSLVFEGNDVGSYRPRCATCYFILNCCEADRPVAISFALCRASSRGQALSSVSFWGPRMTIASIDIAPHVSFDQMPELQRLEDCAR